MSRVHDAPALRLRTASLAAALVASLAACSGGGSGGGGSLTNAAPVPGDAAGPGLSASAAADPNGADWPNFGRDFQHTRKSPQTHITLGNVASLAPKWGTNTAHPLPSTVFAANRADPVVVGNVLYQAFLDGSLWAFNVTTGAVIWEFPGLIHSAMITTPTYYRGTLYAADTESTTTNSTFYSINAGSGHANWQYVTTDPLGKFDGSSVISGSTIYIGSSAVNEVPGKCVHERQLKGLSLFAPALVTSMNLTPTPQNGADVWSTPMIDPYGNLYIATGNECTPNFNQSFPYANALIRVKADPQLAVQWSFQIPEGPGRDLDFGSSPVYVGGLVIDTSKDGYTYALNPTTGKLVWKTFTGMALGSSATDGTRLYVPSAETVFPACLAGRTCGGLYALNVSDGSIAWSIPATTDMFGAGMRSSPAYSNGMVFGAWNGKLWAVDAATGSALWSYTLPANTVIYGGITIVDAGLLAGTSNALNYWCFTPGGK